MVDVQKHSVHTLVFRSLKRSHDMFLCDEGALPPVDDRAHRLRVATKARDDYGPVMHLVSEGSQRASATGANSTYNTGSQGGQDGPDGATLDGSSGALMLAGSGGGGGGGSALAAMGGGQLQLTAQMLKKPSIPKPQWHPPWKLYRVISGHTGWVRCVAFDPTNEWFCTGSNDRIIKIWDLASGKLKLSLTGHISGVRGLAVSQHHPYLFSCGEDKQVKCWDLEQNKVIRHYHGHLSGVYTIGLHPTIDNIIVTGGRDSTARVWDMRTKANIHVLGGHTNTVASVLVQATEPQVVSGSHDSTIRLWDIVAGKTRVTLTHHKKSVRALVLHPKLNMFASGAPDNIKQWMCPDGKFIQNLSGHNTIVNCLAMNDDGVLVSGGDNGSLQFWDWKTGYNFQKMTTPVQPGSIDSEAGIFAMGFDLSGTRLVTCEADKTIKVFKEDENASEETHPINWKPEIIRRKKF